MSRSSGIKPYLEKAKTAFPNMMRRVTKTARDWGVKERHSEKIKPYLMDPDLSYPAMDDFVPTPLSLEFPNIHGEDWTNIEAFGEEAYKFQCIVHLAASTMTGSRACQRPVTAKYGAWTKLGDGGVNNWRFYAIEPYAIGDAKEAGTDITSRLDIKCSDDNCLGNELTVLPSCGSWSPIIEEFSGGKTTGADSYIWLKGVYTDKGQAGGEYYHPLMRKMITIEAGRSVCDAQTNVRCGICPVDPVLTFDDDSTLDVIAPGADLTMYILGGLAPFAWTVSGLGYTLGSASTTGRNNTLTSADGVCDTDYGPIATVTVTDVCGTSVNFKIRNTGGQFVFDSTMCGVGQSYTWECFGTIQGIARYAIRMKAAVGTTCLGGESYPCCADSIANRVLYGFGGKDVCGGTCGSEWGLGAPHTNVCFHWDGTQGWAIWIWKETWAC